MTSQPNEPATSVAGRPGVYFDRDNTLIACDDYLGDPARVKLIPGAAWAVARVRELGYAVVVVSNQSGVGRGMFTEDAVHAVNRRLDELLRSADPGAVVDRHEFCPFHPDAVVEAYRQDSDLRKPRPGMILKARRELGLTEGGWCVGDAPRDIAAGRAAGCRTILLTIRGLAQSPAAMEEIVAPDFTASAWGEVMTIIEREMARGAGAAVAAAQRPVSDKPPNTEKAPSTLRPAASTLPARPLPAAHQPPKTPMAEPTVPTVAPASSSAPLAAPTPPPQPAPPPRPAQSEPRAEPRHLSNRTDQLLEAVLAELKRANKPANDFSISRLLAGVLQVLTIGLLVLTYLSSSRDNINATFISLQYALVLQTMVASLALLGRNR